MKGVESTLEEHERLATGNNNGSLDVKLQKQKANSRSVFYSTRMFMFVFLSAWVLQGMFLTYFVSVTTTVEKLFKIESKTTGLLLAATEIGQICTSLFLTYLAGRGHRPRWIACMMTLVVIGVIGCVIPHMMYGTQILDVHLTVHDAGAAPVCSPTPYNQTCTVNQYENTETRSGITAIVMPWLFVCLLIVGIGQTGIATLGIPYVDDNVGSKQSPLYMAITIGIRVVGPALGFLLGALCTRIYVNPFTDPGYDSSDSRWVGAWWLGMVFIAAFLVVFALLMNFFPKQMKQQHAPPPMPKKNVERKVPLFKDFCVTIKRQITNDILMCRTASAVFHLMPISGIYAFLPKYLEKEFRLPTHDANLISGLGGIFVMGIGIITSGLVILKMVPTARQVAAWTAFTAITYSAGMVVLMFLKCPEENYRLLATPGDLNTTLACSSSCHCDGINYNPVCGQDSFTYLSPCQAGCNNSIQLDNSTWLYYNCSCVDTLARGDRVVTHLKRYDHESLLSESGGIAINGECGGPCKQLYVFIAVFAAVMFIHATGETGAVLLIIRCTDKIDKAMAMGVIQFAIGVFGNVPCPIIFGAAVDAACKLRDTICGAIAGCSSYDSDTLRYWYLGMSASLMFLAFIMDLLVWSRAHRIDMNPPDAASPLQSPAPGGESTLLTPVSPSSDSHQLAQF